MTGGIVASFAGACVDCSGRIEPGDLIVPVSAAVLAGREEHPKWAHALCPDIAAERDDLAAKRQPLCPRCFCHHRGDC